MEYAIVIMIAVIAVVGAWAYVTGANRNSDRLWEELATLRGQYQHLLDIALYRQGLPNSIAEKRREERKLEEANEKPLEVPEYDFFAARQKAIDEQMKEQDGNYLL